MLGRDPTFSRGRAWTCPTQYAVTGDRLNRMSTAGARTRGSLSEVMLFAERVPATSGTGPACLAGSNLDVQSGFPTGRPLFLFRLIAGEIVVFGPGLLELRS